VLNFIVGIVHWANLCLMEPANDYRWLSDGNGAPLLPTWNGNKNEKFFVSSTVCMTCESLLVTVKGWYIWPTSPDSFFMSWLGSLATVRSLCNQTGFTYQLKVGGEITEKELSRPQFNTCLIGHTTSSVALTREGTWKYVDELHDSALRDLASCFPNTILPSHTVVR